MKKLLIISLALIMSSTAFAQKKKSRSLRKMDVKMKALYCSDNFRLSYLVLPPSIYNPDNDSTISRIEFFQDTTTRYKVNCKTFASIDPGQPMNINYIIGYIGLFQATEYTANVIIVKTYKSGKEKTENVTIHFDDIIAPEYGMESAAYGTNEGVIHFYKKKKLIGIKS